MIDYIPWLFKSYEVFWDDSEHWTEKLKTKNQRYRNTKKKKTKKDKNLILPKE